MMTVLRFNSVTSTNDVARGLAAGGAREGTVVLAEEQTAGRGRRGRPWYSPAGKGLWLSIILRPDVSPEGLPAFSLLAGVAVARSIRAATELDAGLKWPNDVMVGGRKVCGILAETVTGELARPQPLVIGIGINVTMLDGDFPTEVRQSATSLVEAVGRGVDREQLVQLLLDELDTLYRVVRTSGFAPVLDLWRQASVTIGRVVEVLTDGGSLRGTAVDIGPQGQLILDVPGEGSVSVLAGDVRLLRGGDP